MKKIICLLLVTLAAGSFFASAANRDSSKLKFHVLLSSRPLINALSARDSAKNFMYSHNQIEVQISYKKHQIGIGFDAAYTKSTDLINNLPRAFTTQSTFFSPHYAYKFYQQKKWSAFVGIGYYVNTIDSKVTVTSPIEVVTNQATQIEEGSNLFLRANYKFTRRFSVEFETAFYRSRERIEEIKDYSLTPALSSAKFTYRDFRTYALPSNIWLKYSF